MRVLQVCAEIFPLLKTGGLADVCGALPAALTAQGCDVRVLLPAFPAIRRGVTGLQPLETALHCPLPLTGARLLQGRLPDATPCYLIEHPGFEREGNPYAGADGQPHGDNHLRFAMLGCAAAMLADGMDAQWRPQVVHGHDWHAGLAPAYVQEASARRGRRLAGTLFTVHNLAFQGLFPLSIVAQLGLPGDFFHVQGLEFHGQVSFMKAGLVYADKVSTVSPSYAQEIQGEEQGCGMDGVMRARAADLSGILNGVDPQVWSPGRDTHIAARYSAARLAGKARCRGALQAEFGLAAQSAAPVFGVVSRLTEQKGMNLVLAGLPLLLQRGAQLVVLGSGDTALEAALTEAARAHPQQVALRLGYDEALAHRIVAGADVILVPSRFEPCGLTQLYGLAYGSLPLVRRVGGLADTVVDASLENLDEDLATGMVFDRFDSQDYAAALRRAVALFRRPQDWRRVQARAMAQHFDWAAAAGRYLDLYEQVATPALPG